MEKKHRDHSFICVRTKDEGHGPKTPPSGP